jgi:transcriptional regulator with XRE-family HTH domain
MGRDVNKIIAELPPERQARIDAGYRALKREVESLSQLRQLAGKAQADVAAALKIRQPSVSKIEKQTNMYLSTLRGYVQAIGGELELVVRLPAHPTLHLHRLGEILERTVVPKAARPRARRKTRAA